jgi:hypothetical protein
MKGVQKMRSDKSPVNWQFNARKQGRCREQVVLQTTNFWKLDWNGNLKQLMLNTDGDKLVQAMVAFTPLVAGQRSLPTAYQKAFAPVFVANRK